MLAVAGEPRAHRKLAEAGLERGRRLARDHAEHRDGVAGANDCVLEERRRDVRGKPPPREEVRAAVAVEERQQSRLELDPSDVDQIAGAIPAFERLLDGVPSQAEHRS